MLDLFKYDTKHPFYVSEIYKKRYSVSIPFLDNKNDIKYHNENVNELVKGFDQRNMTEYDQYLINDVLGIPNANHEYSQYENGD